MKHLTRPASLLLALLLCAGLMSFPALATDEPAIEAEPVTEDAPVQDGATAITEVRVLGSAGDTAASFVPNMRFTTPSNAGYSLGAGLTSWYYGERQSIRINNGQYAFCKGCKYNFSMFITANSGYSFAQNVKVVFEDDRLSCSFTPASDKLYVTVYLTVPGEFQPDPISFVELKDFTEPLEGESPDRDVTVVFSNTSDSAYVGWYDKADTTKDVTTFEAGHTYLMTVRVTALTGFAFEPNGPSVYLDGRFASQVKMDFDAGFDREYGRYGYLEAYFEFTVAARTKIGSVGLCGLSPYAGDSTAAVPVSSLSCGASTYSFYSGYIQWYNENGTPAGNSTFQAGKTYRFSVTYYIPDTSTYVFDKTASAYIDGMDYKYYTPTVQENTGDRLTVLYSVTIQNRPSVIDSVNIAIAAPNAGNAPAYTAVTGVGTALYKTDPVTWYPNGGGSYMTAGQRFVKGSTYRVTIWLAAADGYAFKTSGTSPAVTATVNGQPAAVRKAYEQAADEVIEIEYDFGLCGSILMGDADGSGAVNAFDAAILVQYAAERAPWSAVDFDAADVNRDGRIDEKDAARILKGLG